jgi:hypothetical protein
MNNNPLNERFAAEAILPQRSAASGSITALNLDFSSLTLESGELALKTGIQKLAG